VEGAQVAAELQALRPVPGLLDVAVELVLGQVQGGEQVPYPAVTVVGGPASAAWLAVRILVLAAAFGPLPSRVRHEVMRTELVHAEDNFGFAVLG
jgi:hypothetical protein